jgi:hypothetical protein
VTSRLLGKYQNHLPSISVRNLMSSIRRCNWNMRGNSRDAAALNKIVLHKTYALTTLAILANRVESSARLGPLAGG